MNKLDLHGVRHVEVQREVDKFIGEQLLRGTEVVFIITGHSDKMKELLGSTLSDYGMYYEEIPFNAGEVKVELV